MKFAALFFLIVSLVRADEVSIALLEKDTNRTHFYAFDLAAHELLPRDQTRGTALPPIDRYRVKDGRLWIGKNDLAAADEILAQVQVDGLDLLIVRSERDNSDNPIKVLGTLLGLSRNPLRFTKITLLEISGGEVRHRAEIMRSEDQHTWQAKFCR